MAILHATPGHPIDVSPLGERLASSQTVALFKSRDLEVMRIVLPTGKAMPPHKLGGDLTLHCLEGLLEVVVQGQTTELAPGQLVYLPGGSVHSVTARAPSSALLTIALHPPE
jgi:quercetin dioxygenase-like cupin family protein